jgi:RNA polymerase sigma-70 factor (ECF subfamily)
VTDDDDFTLLRAWRDGGAAAGNRLFRRHFTPVFRFFSTKVDDDAAADLTQRTFMACTHKRDDVVEASTFRAYILGVARIELLRFFDEWRRRGRRFDAASTSIEDLGASPSAVVAEREEQKLVLRALHRLPLDFQITLELHYWQELTTAEIAEALSVSAGTVKSRLHRGRALLRRTIAELDAAPETRDSTIEHLDDWLRFLPKP